MIIHSAQMYNSMCFKEAGRQEEMMKRNPTIRSEHLPHN